MTSMFDKSSSTVIMEASDDDPSSGVIHATKNKDVPIFAKQKMNLNLPCSILYISVQNDWIMILMTNLTVLRMNIKQPDKFTEVPIEKFIGGLRPTNIYLDPLGSHLIITLASKSPGFTSELVYLQRNSFKPKLVSKLKGHEITAIGFNNYNSSEINTGPILLGTAKGIILEADIGLESGDKLLQNNVRQIFDVGKEESRLINGIEFHLKFNQQNLYCIILVLTLDRLYMFQESISIESCVASTSIDIRAMGYLQKVFSSYLNIPDYGNSFDVVNCCGNYSRLAINYAENFPTSFGYLVEDGINYHEIDRQLSRPQFVVQKELIPYPQRQIPLEKSFKLVPKAIHPISLALTSFHAILLYDDHVTAISLLNYQVVYEEYFDEQHGRLVNIVKDMQSSISYFHSKKMIFRYKITNEQRNVWKLLADRQKFDVALKYCINNPAHRDIVFVKQAQIYFECGNFLEAAHICSLTSLSFEEVCLKILRKKQYEALKLYLRNRFVQLNVQERTQITMLIVWMVELYLLDISGHGCSNYVEKVNELEKQFENFIKSPTVIQCLKENRSVIHELMASHGNANSLTALTTLHKDYESAINHYITQNRFEEALTVLRTQTQKNLFYKYAPILMEHLPSATIEVLLAQGMNLDPVKLMPVLLCLDSDEHVNCIIRYLEFCTHSPGCELHSIHNYLIQLYSEYHPSILLTFLESQGKDISMINYDAKYALRLCLKQHINNACVFLLCLLGKWISAVEHALLFDVTLAKQTASQSPDRSLRKKLWIIIAENKIRNNDKNSVQELLQFLNESDLLMIEDVLPFFSDFQKIDHFKDIICQSLKQYNSKIFEQRKDMDESVKSAARIRSELQSFRNRSLIIGAMEQCAICYTYLLVKPFFVFNCGHKCHNDCLEQQMVARLPNKKATKLIMLKKSLAQFQHVDCSPLLPISHKEKVKKDIEKILAADCIYCGELMINAIDKPFLESRDEFDNDW